MSANRRAEAIARLRSFVRFVEQEDEKMVEQVLQLSRSRRLFAPLAYTVGAFAMLLGGLRRLIGDWWLIAIELLPAIWLWLAMYDLRQQAFHSRSFHGAHEARLAPGLPRPLFVLTLSIAVGLLMVVNLSRPGAPAAAGAAPLTPRPRRRERARRGPVGGRHRALLPAQPCGPAARRLERARGARIRAAHGGRDAPGGRGRRGARDPHERGHPRGT